MPTSRCGPSARAKPRPPADASGAHGTLRRRLAEAWGGERAATVRILYGGSVNPGERRAQLLASPDIDGVLVGGASLDPDSFARIAEAARPLNGGRRRLTVERGGTMVYADSSNRAK